MRALTTASLLACLLATGCPKPGFVPALAPRRPEATPLPPRVKVDTPKFLDCAPTDPASGPPAKAYKDRVPDMAQHTAEEGKNILVAAEAGAHSPIERDNLLTQAVGKLLEALAADPYNVLATYNLASAYARIGRKQCSLNMLARLAEMAAFPSQRDDVSDMADYLIGRHKHKPDPDFDDLRSDERFLQIVKRF